MSQSGILVILSHIEQNALCAFWRIRKSHYNNSFENRYRINGKPDFPELHNLGYIKNMVVSHTTLSGGARLFSGIFLFLQTGTPTRVL